MKIIDLKDIIIRNNEPLITEIDGEKVMLSLELDKYFGMNTVGSYIWELLQTKMTLGQLIDELVNHFNVDRSVCEKQTQEFLQELLKQKLISVLN